MTYVIQFLSVITGLTYQYRNVMKGFAAVSFVHDEYSQHLPSYPSMSKMKIKKITDEMTTLNPTQALVILNFRL